MPWVRRGREAYFVGRQQRVDDRLCSCGCGCKATVLCDAPGGVEGQCNKQLSIACAVKLAGGIHFCPSHPLQTAFAELSAMTAKDAMELHTTLLEGPVLA